VYREIRAEMGKGEGIKEQVLSGSKIDQWFKPEQSAGAEDPLIPGMGKSKKKLPSLGAPPIGGAPKPPPAKPKPGLPGGDMGGGAMPPAPKAPLDVKAPPTPGSSVAPMESPAALPPTPKAPGSENAPGVGGL
jgi:hypothetical protein